MKRIRIYYKQMFQILYDKIWEEISKIDVEERWQDYKKRVEERSASEPAKEGQNGSENDCVR